MAQRTEGVTHPLPTPSRSRHAKNKSKTSTRGTSGDFNPASTVPGDNGLPPHDGGSLADLSHLVQDRKNDPFERFVPLWGLFVVRSEVDNKDVARSGLIQVFDSSAEPVDKACACVHDMRPRKWWRVHDMVHSVKYISTNPGAHVGIASRCLTRTSHHRVCPEENLGNIWGEIWETAKQVT